MKMALGSITRGVLAHVYGYTYLWLLPRRNSKKTIMSFTNCDNHTNEIAICLNTCSLELLHFTSLHLIAFYFIALYLSCILISALVVHSRNLFTHTHTVDPSFA